jgi:serine/threonine-protein kinase RsbW
LIFLGIAYRVSIPRFFFASMLSRDEWSWQCDRILPNDTDAVCRPLDDMLQQMARLHWTSHDIFGVHLAVYEGFVNAVSHGNASDPAKHIRLSCRVSSKKVQIEIVDEGEGFNPSCLPDCTDNGHLECPGGRGVMLMKAMMNRVEFLDHGNHILLEKERL